MYPGQNNAMISNNNTGSHNAQVYGNTPSNTFGHSQPQYGVQNNTANQLNANPSYGQPNQGLQNPQYIQPQAL